jgi:hypothetical protein
LHQLSAAVFEFYYFTNKIRNYYAMLHDRIQYIDYKNDY